jgi:hypothetical protein
MLPQAKFAKFLALDEDCILQLSCVLSAQSRRDANEQE